MIMEMTLAMMLVMTVSDNDNLRENLQAPPPFNSPHPIPMI